MVVVNYITNKNWFIRVASAGSAVAIAGVSSLFFSEMASDLRYYNSTHIHNQIYMDLNMTLSYSFHVLK